VIDGRGGVKAAGHGDGAVGIREDGLLLGAHREAAAERLVVDVAGGGLIGEPFAHVAFVELGMFGQFCGICGPDFGQGPVKAEAIPEDDEGAANG
jgi:hypothetical protein